MRCHLFVRETMLHIFYCKIVIFFEPYVDIAFFSLTRPLLCYRVATNPRPPDLPYDDKRTQTIGTMRAHAEEPSAAPYGWLGPARHAPSGPESARWQAE